MKKSPKKKMASNEEKRALSSNQCTVTSWSQWWQNYMNCTSNCFRTHPIFQIWTPPFADLKKMPQKKRFGSNEVMSETEAYFEAKDNSFYKKGIELLEKRWNQCITQEGDLMNKVEFCLKVVLLVRPGTYWVMCYRLLTI